MEQTFWQIIDNSKIEIPEIQRDYAQGRDTPKANAIRKKFVSDLINSCRHASQPLHLDFIFGQSIHKESIAQFEKSKESLQQMAEVLERFSSDHGIDFQHQIGESPVETGNDRTLIPIDGQQRLTTLFLFHLYIGARVSANAVQKLKSFQYKTRKSSTSFINQLVENAQVLKRSDDIQLSAEIRDQAWFFEFWDKDPTVAGMLMALDEIQNQCRALWDDDLGIIWQSLTESKRVSFDFFDLKEEGLEDDLYVKMNARGKPLSDFENFKAWLEKQYKASEEIKVTDWLNKLDKEWLDIFWSERMDVEGVDQHYLAFFNTLALFKKLEMASISNDRIDEDIIGLINRLGSDKFIPTAFYEEKEVHTVDSVNWCFSVLEILSSKEDRNFLNELIEEVWTDTFYNIEEDNGKFTSALLRHFPDLSNLYHKVFVYAVLIFLRHISKPVNKFSEDDKINFLAWLRVSRNIIYNSRIDDNVPYINAIQSLNKFDAKAILNINEFLQIQLRDKSWISFFSQKQQSEEIQKAKMDPEWNEVLHEAENHFYFYGQVGFIIELSKQEGVANLELFKKYWQRLNQLFTPDHLDNGQFLIQRALLTIGDHETHWMRPLTSNRWSFYRSIRSNSRQRDENWRYLFVNDDNGQRLSMLKKLLDECECSTGSLEKLIKGKEAEIRDWRIYFIKEPALFRYCGQMLMNWEGKEHIRLLGNSRLSHYHSELRITALHEWLKGKEIASKLIKVKKGSDRSFLEVGDNQSKCQVRYARDTQSFEYKLNEDTDYKAIDDNCVYLSYIQEFNNLET
ncbi:DUF262 domain-containing protein [Cyclobacterium salsum]|uniref:DUF262 domain-containing protein n=1 Tax=Cyclobacterium salsum TaxID=2666329 RepID=UPI001390911E|nr:DUF262 domain-containing protein [Cyclobacterium salsum]